MREEIITFLEKICDDFKNDTLSEENKKLITEFFVSYQYANSDLKKNDLTQKEMLKYLF